MSGYSFDLTRAGFLVLLIALPPVLWWARSSLSGIGRGRMAAAIALRSLALILIVLALSGMRILRENERLCVIFVVDASDSIPPEHRQLALDQIREAQKRRDEARGDLVGLVIFGRDAGVEIVPRPAAIDLRDFATLIQPEATNIQDAIQLAVTAFPEDAGGRRLVLFTDGNQNIGQALEEVRSARSLGITVDVVPVVYAHEREMSVEKLILPPSVAAGQPFSLQVVVHSTDEADVELHLFENGALLPQEDPGRRLKPGKNFFQIAGLRREVPGQRLQYEVQVEPLSAAADAVPRNNRAHGFTMVEGPPRVLLCASEPHLETALIGALEGESIAVDVVGADSLPRSPEEYFGYSSIILSSVGADRLLDERMQLFEGLVKGLGIGLVMVGGEESFGAGGYRGTPIERILPVDMDLRQKKVLPNGALAFVVHSCELGNGNFWARQVIRQAIRTLSPRDFAGVLYFDNMGQDRWLFPMTRCDQKQRMLSLLRGFNPGDMPSFQSILQMAHAGLTNLPPPGASIKHMIVLSDGDPGAPSASLMAQIVRSRTTVSTICYGAHPNIPPTLQDMARQGKGQYHFLTSPNQLPQLFIREAATVRKSLISEEPFQPLVSAWGQILQGLDLDAAPALDGYVLTSAKPLADLLLVHPGTAEDPSQDPVLAAWQYGLGRSVAFTSDAGRRWGQRWVSWAGYQRFWGQLVSWASRSTPEERFRVRSEIEGDEARITIDALSRAGEFVNGLRIRGSVMGPGPRYETRDVRVRQVGPGRYQAAFPVGAEGTYGIQLESEQDGVTTSYRTGLTVPYSPEYRQLSTDHELLGRLAGAGGGRLFTGAESSDLFFSREFTGANSAWDAWRTLLMWAIALFFADVFVRRVLVDLGAIGRKAAAVLAAVRGRRPQEARSADERLAALLRAKERAREEAGAQAAGRPRQEPAGGAAGAPAARLDDRFDAGAAPPPLPVRNEPEAAGEEPRPESSGEPAEAGEPDGEETYTSRLLKAKRRALKRDD